MVSKARFQRAPDVEDEPVPALLDVARAPEPSGPSSTVVRAAFGVAEAPEQTALIREVWGDAILAEPKKVNAIIRAQNVIADENGTMLSAAINMGRALLEAREQLSAEEFARGLRQSRRAWRGWSSGNVYKLMAVAGFYDRHQFAPQQVPQSYTTLYEFAALPEEQFQQTMKLGLFRPDVKRTDIQAFKHKLASGELDPSRTHADVSPHEPEVERLQQRLRHLEGETERVRKRLKEARRLDQEWRKAHNL